MDQGPPVAALVKGARRVYGAPMNAFVQPPPAQPAVPVVGGGLFAVRRILCVGRNYAAHRREMGGDDPDPPFFFAKPADALVPDGGDIAFPSATENLHHEVELVLALGGGGVDIAPEQALALVFGCAVGVDLTRRDLQAQARAKGQPWEAAKGFDGSAPISRIVRRTGGLPQGRIELHVNGALRQEATLTDMIWSPVQVIAQASRLWRLAPGDLIFTGTPEGVGPLVRGDEVDCAIAGIGALAFRMV